ncbi:Eukaryotic translation initiation factor 2 subunit beta [Vitis vinifera]|uniref:Eukaryotic translation initiation factor 2 subunit beta n=1 Tax=Vitis vinifera TaxID=29760 RepID=A0A438F984_VITVI|nr:Eukaryotic translation initiation factor 2 subunit beta [Vitis vinifera]
MADENQNEVKDEVAELAPFDPTKKKKKKKVVIQDPADDSVDKLAEKTESLSVSEGVENTFSGMKKKKKKPVETDILNDDGGDGKEDLDDTVLSTLLDHNGEDEEGEGIVLQPRYPWEGSDRDYKYEEFNISWHLACWMVKLLGRVFNILRENNPELAGDRRRTVMRPHKGLPFGSNNSCSFVGILYMSGMHWMHRQPDHVMAFLLAELGTSGSLDGQQRLVVKGRFAPKNFEGILRRYIILSSLPHKSDSTSLAFSSKVELKDGTDEYVICLGCKSPDTILSKENRLFFLRCEQCGSGRSVAPIKAGFVARVGRRNTGT